MPVNWEEPFRHSFMLLKIASFGCHTSVLNWTLPQYSDAKKKTNNQPTKNCKAICYKACFYLGLPGTLDFFFLLVPSRKFYPSRTEEHVHLSGFLDVQQQLWSDSSVSRTPEHILWVCKAHPYSTCRARLTFLGNFEAIKHAAHRQSAYAD